MKKSITLLLFFLISINFCEDNSQREDSIKIQALSLLAVQSQNANKQSQGSTTCDFQININSNIDSAVNKYNDCNSDSECAFFSGVYPKWGQKCDGCYPGTCGGLIINSTKQLSLAKELINLNETYCIGTFTMNANCLSIVCPVASCVHPDYIKIKCINKKCGGEILPF